MYSLPYVFSSAPSWLTSRNTRVFSVSAWLITAPEALGAADGAPQLEELHGIGAVRDGLIAHHAHLAGALERVVRLPVLLARRLLHEHVRLAAADAAHQIVAHGHSRGREVVARIAVPADDVELLAQIEVVDVHEHAHQIGGDRRLRVELADRGLLVGEAARDGPAHEPAVVDGGGGQRGAPGRPFVAQGVGHHDVVPVVDRVPPEMRVPRLVQRLDGAVLRLEPLDPLLAAVVAIAVGPVFVGDVPRDQARRVGVPLGELAGQFRRVLAEGRRVRAGVVSIAELVAGAVEVGVHHVRVAAGHPRGDGRGGRGQHDAEVVVDEQLDDAVERGEVVLVLAGLQLRPREHVDRGLVDAGVLQHLDVLAPDVLAPLLRIPVAAVVEAVEYRLCHYRFLNRCE